MINSSILPSSFRDPSGFLFIHDGVMYRQVNNIYKDNYDHLLHSKLYDSLVKQRLLVAHDEVTVESPMIDRVYKVIKPQHVSFISYPYEWCFSQLKDAALTTLEIQRRALDFGMCLKDCSAYNIQFVKGKPILIDTLSLEKYVADRPWVAYRQFCQHFLAPLALMSYRDIRLGQLSRIHIDGVPLDLTSLLLPFHSRLKFPLLSHIHLHARSQRHFADKMVGKREHTMSRRSLIAIIDNLVSAIENLRWSPVGTEWSDYYQDTNYSEEAITHKKQILSEFVQRTKSKSVWDLGANIGTFSRVASDKGIETIAFDIDPGAVERNYLDCIEKREEHILPLLMDLTNPSSGIGWQNRERLSLIERGPVDTVFALALVHHLAIANNLPFDKIADFLSAICKYLVIEFVPKDDSQICRLLATREDIFSEYTQHHFQQKFSRYFRVKERVPIRNSKRIMYLMEENSR